MTLGRHADAPGRRVDQELPDEQHGATPSRRVGTPERPVDSEPPDLQVCQEPPALPDKPYQTRSGRAVKKPSRFL